MPSILYAGELEVLIDELIEILHDQAAQAGVEYRFGDSIATLEPDDDDVNVSFEHAPPQRFDLVIGSDGAHSTVRRLIFGPEEDFTHYLGCYYGYWTVDNRLGLDHEGMATGDGETAALSVFSVKHKRQARAGLLFKADRPLPYGRRDITAHKSVLKERAAHLGSLQRREPHGVWGGEIFTRGVITARKRPRGRPPNTPRRTSCTR